MCVLALLAWSTAAVGGPIGRAGVAADHELASACGAEVMLHGGNAADAAVASALCAGVVQPAGSGLGGGGFAVVVGPDGSVRDVIDFRERAPAAAHRDMYRTEDGGVDPVASREGGLAVATPAESRGLAALLARHGRLTPRQVAAPAARLAARGFRVGEHLGRALERSFDEEIAAEFAVDGRTAEVGDVVRRPALARTLRRWGATAGEDLHVGRGADLLLRHLALHDAIVTSDDLAEQAPSWRVPIVVRWGERTIVTMPPPSSGGVVLAQVLRVLEGEDLAALGWNSATYVHRLTEAMKHAYADRAHHMGDPDHVDVPVARLLSDARIAEVRAAFDPSTTLPPEAYGPLISAPRDDGTQHISALDADGLAVSLTTTINTSFGSQLVDPGTGIVLNNEMDDFSAAPGVPNAYGLIGGEENAIAPFRRPLSSMTPTVVLDGEGRVELVVGASGGSQIISSTLQVLLNVLVFDMAPDRAVAAPRFHHQWQPDRLFVEEGIPREVRVALEALGHTLDVRPAYSSVQALHVGEDERVRGGADPRKGGEPAMIWLDGE